MPTYRITGPDGATYEVTAPDGASEQDVLSFVQSQAGSAPAPAPQQPEMSLGEVAGDVAKSAGIGVVQGGIGLATLPGNVEALGRAGINAAAGLVGAQPPVSGETFLPTYTDWKKRVEDRTGEFYKPKTTLGEYARTGGEFASLALGGPGGWVSRGARVAIPALASETAGQVTKGSSLEPWARMGGALVGGRLTNPAARTVTPAPANPVRQGSVRTLENEGVTALTAGQRTGNARLRQIEDATSLFPGGGGRATAMQQQASEQFTRAALARAGVQADRATPDVIDDAFQRIGQEYNNFAAATPIPGRAALQPRFQAVANEYIANTSDAMRIAAVPNFARELGTRLSAPAGITGRQYNTYRSELARLQRGMRNDPQASTAIGAMIRELDNAMIRSSPIQMRRGIRNALQDRNRRYRNLLAIEDASGAAGEAAASGLITPAALKNAIKKNDKKGYTRNRNDMAPLARAGTEVLTPLRSSGTAERSFAQQMVSAPASAVGSLTAGAMTGFDPLMMAAAASPYLISAATARGLMSVPAQRYFANQRIPQNLDPTPWQMTAPLAAMQFEGALPLRGGVGPRYDREYGLLGE